MSGQTATEMAKRLPETQAEWDAVKRQLAAIIEVDYGFGTDGRWLGFAYESGLFRVKFASGDIIAAQAPDVESAIEGMRVVAMDVGRMTKRAFSFCRVPPIINVHRVPADCDKGTFLDWVNSIGLDCVIHEVHAADAGATAQTA